MSVYNRFSPGQFWVTFHGNTSTIALTNHVASPATEIGSISRNQIDLTGYRQVRLSAYVSVVGAATAALQLEYTLDAGSTWLPLSSTCSIAVSSVVAVSTWADLPLAQDLLVRCVGVNGDGAADPAFKMVMAQFR